MARKRGVKKLDAGKVINQLMSYYESGARYMVPNIYFFDKSYGETDLLIVKEGKNGFIYDIEVKISRADFKADFKKVIKHEILKKGTMTFKRRKAIKTDVGKRRVVPANTPIPTKERPNRFYFAVPEGLITKEEVPEYAGLLYILPGGGIEKVKEGKLLHKSRVDHEAILCRKFYFYWMNCVNKLTKSSFSKS